MSQFIEASRPEPSVKRRPLTGIAFALLILAVMPAAAEVVLRTEVPQPDAAADASSTEPASTDPEGAESGVLPGDVLRFTIVFSNEGMQAAAPGSIVITNPLPDGTAYLAGTAQGPDTFITYSVDGEYFAAAESLSVATEQAARPADAADYRSIRWTFEPLLAPGESSQVAFELVIVPDS